jgi:hypothetical protein
VVLDLADTGEIGYGTYDDCLLHSLSGICYFLGGFRWPSLLLLAVLLHSGNILNFSGALSKCKVFII